MAMITVDDRGCPVRTLRKEDYPRAGWLLLRTMEVPLLGVVVIAAVEVQFFVCGLQARGAFLFSLNRFFNLK
jgi:hypothetical protein